METLITSFDGLRTNDKRLIPRGEPFGFAQDKFVKPRAETTCSEFLYLSGPSELNINGFDLC